MATLWIREYSDFGGDKRATVDRDASMATRAGGMQVPKEPGTDQTPVTFTTSAQSAAFATGTGIIAMIASAAFHYVVADDPTATTSALKVPADTLVFIGVKAGQKVAAIAAA